ncbi:hypothetical protein BJ944DRAFT_240807 [Cunninghamella echinulata]|nr:hypothetical protein BJ944DRAFT_240807 [Cunninghamella echinulata]
MKPLRSTADIIYKTNDDPTILALKITDNVSTFGYLYYVDLKCPSVKNYPLKSSYESMLAFLQKAKNNTENINTGQTCVLLHVLADYLVGRNHAMLLLDISSCPTNEEMITIKNLFTTTPLFSCIHGYTTRNNINTNNWAVDEIITKLKYLECEKEDLIKQNNQQANMINYLEKELNSTLIKLSDATEKNKNCESKIDNIAQYKASLEKHYQHILHQKNDIQAEKETMEKKQLESEIHMKTLKDQLLEKEKYEELNSVHLKQKQELNSSLAIIDSLDKKMKEASYQSDVTMNSLIKKYEADKSDLKDRLQRSSDKIKLLETKIKELSRETITLKNTIEDHNKLVNQNKSTKAQNHSRLEEHFHQQKREINQRYHYLNEYMNQQQQHIKQLQHDIDNLKQTTIMPQNNERPVNKNLNRNEITSKYNENQLQNYTDSFHNKIESLEKEMEVKQKQIEKLMNQLDKAISWNKVQTENMEKERIVLLQWIELIRTKWDEFIANSTDNQQQRHHSVDTSVENNDDSLPPTLVEFPDYTLPISLSKHIPIYVLKQPSLE